MMIAVFTLPMLAAIICQAWENEIIKENEIADICKSVMKQIRQNANY